MTIVDLRNEFNRSRRSRRAISRPLQQAMRLALQDDGQSHPVAESSRFFDQYPMPGLWTRHQMPRLRHRLDAPPPGREGHLPLLRPRNHGTSQLSRSATTTAFAIRGWARSDWRRKCDRGFRTCPILRMDSDTMQQAGQSRTGARAISHRRSPGTVGDADDCQGTGFSQRHAGGCDQCRHRLALSRFSSGGADVSACHAGGRSDGAWASGAERVLVQTFSPDHPAILAAQRHDYIMFANNELPIHDTNSAIHPFRPSFAS